MRPSFAIALFICGIALLTLSAGPRAGSNVNVTADLVLGQDDLVHNQANLVDAGSLSNVRNFTGQGVTTDSLGHVYLSDNGNNRILGWRNMSALVNGQGADLVLGQPDFLSSYCNQSQYSFGPSSSNNTLCGPAGLAVDSASNLYVADRGNDRVLEYNTPFNTCAGFPCVGPAANLAIVGQCIFLDATALCGPSSVAVDSSGNVYVADRNDNRVLEFNDPLGSGSPNVIGANLVFGQGASGTNFGADTCADGSAYKNPPPTSTALCLPTGVAVDKSDNLYIVDNQNSRVLEYKTPLASSPPNVIADLVFGQGTSGTNFGANTCAENIYGTPPPSATALCFPTDVAIDGSGNVYITDNTNSRVLEYNNPLGSNPPNVTANLVFGQGSSGSDFTDNACTGLPPPPGIEHDQSSATGLCFPEGLTVDGGGDLWVADTSNNRLLEYTTPLTTDVTADLVLGQIDFTHNRGNRTKAQGLDFPALAGLYPTLGTAVDAFDNVYVTDFGNNRVLGWRNAGALVNGQPADLVIGQPDFNSYMINHGALSPTAGTLRGPAAVGVDSAGNLYVADYGNNRVLEYNTPFSACSSFPCVVGSANIVFGIDATGKNFTTAGTCSAPTATDLCQPASIAIDTSGNVYISDNGFGRVLEYNNPLGSNPPNVTADLVFGIDSTGKNFTARGGPTAKLNANGIDSPVGLALDANGNLYVADNQFNRILEFNNPVGSNPPNVTADLVIGVDSTGKNFNSLGTCGVPGEISLCFPTGMALDRNGNLYVAGSGWNQVVEYNNPLGSNPPNVIADLAFSPLSGDYCNFPVSATELCNPGGLAFDTQGNLYVADTGNNRVVVYNQPLGGSSSAPTPTPPTPTATATPTPTVTPTPTNTATPSATPTADAILQVQPKAIRFPDQAVGKQRPASQTRQLVLLNPKNGRQNASITIGSITSTDPEFQTSSRCNGRVLTPGEHCLTEVVFKPNSPGPHAGTIKIPSNAMNQVQEVMVKGKGR